MEILVGGYGPWRRVRWRLELVGQYRLAEIFIQPAGRQRSRSSFIALAVMAMLPAVNIRDRAFQAIWPGPLHENHFAVGMAWAIDSPLKWTKQVASHCIFLGEHVKDASRLEVQQRAFFQQIRIPNRPASLFLS